MKSGYLLLALWSLPGLLFAGEMTRQSPAPALQQLAERLTAPLQAGDFRQQKTVAGLPLPLLSAGHFQFQDGQLHWQTLEPFSAEIRFTEAAIEQWQDGTLRWSLSRAEQPVVAVVSELMRALVLSDLEALGRHFSVQALNFQQDCWQLDLAVLDSALAQALQKISAAGCARVDSLQVWERNGNHTHIQLLQAVDD